MLFYLYEVTETYDHKKIREVSLCHLNGLIRSRNDFAQQKLSLQHSVAKIPLPMDAVHAVCTVQGSQIQ